MVGIRVKVIVVLCNIFCVIVVVNFIDLQFDVGDNQEYVSFEDMDFVNVNNSDGDMENDLIVVVDREIDNRKENLVINKLVIRNVDKFLSINEFFFNRIMNSYIEVFYNECFQKYIFLKV